MARKIAVFASVLLALQLCVWAPVALADHSGHDHGDGMDHSDHSDHSGHSNTTDADMEMDHSDHSGNSDHSGHAGHGSSLPDESMSGAIPGCATDPTAAGCVSYMYPDTRAEMDIEANCEAMPFMVACNVWSACKAGDMDGDICAPFNILASTCQDEGMQNMVGCAVYTRMCLIEPDSVVEQCEGAGIARLVPTMSTQMMIVENCGTHSMPGCSECTGESNLCPNTLESLQRVCNAHAMEMCAGYNAMCNVNTDMEHFCGNRGGTFDPPMRMYFHNGIRDIVLFRRFVPENGGEYFGAIVFCIAMGLIASAVRVYRGTLEAAERVERTKVVRTQTSEVAEHSLFTLPKGELVPRMWHGILSFVLLTLDYALMLAAMTFNVGIFFAVVAGLTLGMLFFRPIGNRAMERMQARSLQEEAKGMHEIGSTDGKSGSGDIAAKEAVKAGGKTPEPDLLVPAGAGEPECCAP